MEEIMDYLVTALLVGLLFLAGWLGRIYERHNCGDWLVLVAEKLGGKATGPQEAINWIASRVRRAAQLEELLARPAPQPVQRDDSEFPDLKPGESPALWYDKRRKWLDNKLRE